MALSSGGRSLLNEVVGVIAALSLAGFAVVFATEIKLAGYALFGLTPSIPRDAQMSVAVTANRTAETPTSSSTRVELVAGRNGHFFTAAEVNGRRIETMVDTGASIIALTYDDARTIGVAPGPRDFTHSVSTANGTAKVAPVMLDRVQIGEIMVRNVNAVVIEEGKLTTTLLGNSFLSRLSRYEMRGGRLVMEE